MGKKKSPQLTISKLDLQLSELQTKKDELINSIRVNIKAKNEKQKVYKKYLKDGGKQIVVGCGSPGTGKSFVLDFKKYDYPLFYKLRNMLKQ